MWFFKNSPITDCRRVLMTIKKNDNTPMSKNNIDGVLVQTIEETLLEALPDEQPDQIILLCNQEYRIKKETRTITQYWRPIV